MQEKDVIKLLEKYRLGQCTPAEKASLETWYNSQAGQSQDAFTGVDFDRHKNEHWAIITENIPAPRRPQPVLLRKWMAIAASLMIISVGAYFLWQKAAPAKLGDSRAFASVVPGGNKAILTLASGKQIVLTGAKNGNLAMEGNASINKTADGDVIYKQAGPGQGSNAPLVYNTITTPLGGQYRLTLADGTNVWLNASSSIKYPTQFDGNDRKVQITGEVYFEVAHNAAKPFKVFTNRQEVDVLGTHFNINAYPDEEAIKTTLLQGSVMVIAAGGSKTIKPAEQAVLQGDKLTVHDANVEEAVAWKNGYFRFNDEKISSIMRKLSRWYDVEIRYEGSLSDNGLNGTISRYRDISQVLKMLEQTKEVHFKIEGRKITVSR